MRALFDITVLLVLAMLTASSSGLEGESLQTPQSAPEQLPAEALPEMSPPPEKVPWRGSLHQAANSNDLSLARKLLVAGASVNARVDGDGRPPLGYAAAQGHLEMARLLLDAGADVDGCDGDGYCVIAMACGAAQPEMVQLLLDEGADVHAATGYTRRTALMDAADIDRKRLAYFEVSEREQDGIVRALLASGADPNGANYRDEAPLAMAAGEGYGIIVKTLLESGAKPDRQTNIDRSTALMAASEGGYASTVAILLESGADTSLRDRTSRNAADYGWRHAAVLDLLEKAGVDVTGPRNRNAALHVEVPAEQTARATAALAARGYELTEERWGRAVMDGDLEAIELFLEAGMSPDAADLVTESPLLRAVSNCSQGEPWDRIASALIAAGADPGIADSNGNPPLIWAVSKCPLNVLKGLVDAGADIDFRNLAGATPLMQARAHGRNDVVALLKAAGATAE